MSLSILYRGSLSSCNYACPYCPFAKTRNSPEELRADAAELSRFVDWVEDREREIRVFFTPWGEALHLPAYQQAMTRLSHMSHVSRVAIQTNLSGRLSWVADADHDALALWSTYHPGEVSRERFLSQAKRLLEAGVRFSVGVVGFREHFDEIASLREALPEEVYLWVNAVKRLEPFYGDDEIGFLTDIDPHFVTNTIVHPSLGKACHAGHTVISVDGAGTMRRCHFLPEPIGSIYQADWASALVPRPCTAAGCRCHIGYVHLEPLGLDQVYGDGILERIPTGWAA